MVFFYRTSLIATVISILGCASTAGGAMLLFLSGDWLGIVFVLLGIPGIIGGRIIHLNKTYEKWWAENVDSEQEQEIAQSREKCIEVYNKNPQRRAIKKISQLNPEAGAHIQERIKQLIAKRYGR